MLLSIFKSGCAPRALEMPLDRMRKVDGGCCCTAASRTDNRHGPDRTAAEGRGLRRANTLG
jgi:hypothetical protein